MRSTAIAAIVFALAAVTATAAAAAPRLVYRVDKVTAAIVRGRLVVSVNGAVSSGGWTAPRLHLRELTAAEVNTETVEFLATPPPPDTVVIQALLPMTTTAVFPLPRYAVTQVKVESENNAVIAQITPEAPVAPAAPYRSP
jgi:hypothetical protein